VFLRLMANGELHASESAPTNLEMGTTATLPVLMYFPRGWTGGFSGAGAGGGGGGEEGVSSWLQRKDECKVLRWSP
jgi:hypothetical protein